MTKVIQIRDVSDELHARLVDAAAEDGKSLTKYVRDELMTIAKRAEAVAHNRRVFEESQAEFAALDISRADTRRAIDEDRDERERRFDGTGTESGA